MRNVTLALLSAFLLVLAVPTLAAEEGAGVEPAAAAASQGNTEICGDSVLSALPGVDPAAELFSEAAGCTATYNCVHGTIVSCSSSTPSTCTSSGARCGSVTCNGTTTWCPGACISDHHCASFCFNQGSSDGYCDSFGCCVCL